MRFDHPGRERRRGALPAAVAGGNVDMVMAAIVGAAGLPSTLAAVRAGKRVLLANKEALVMAGRLLMDEVRRAGAELIPIDSEHNAIFQCMPAGYLPGDAARGVTRRDSDRFRRTVSPRRSATSIEHVTPDEACAHPKWKMGRKISVDSATLMNKGLEVIEATLLFGLPESQVDVVVHPQSVVHSLVEYADGSMLAQLGAPDMRTPIAQALAWPERFASGVQSLDLVESDSSDSSRRIMFAFPSLELARAAARAGGTAPAVLNAANEVAVQAFLDRRLNFTGIATVIDKVLQRLDSSPVKALGDVLDADAAARRLAIALIELGAGALRMKMLLFIAAFLVAISILVAVHEFGHYWVAKKLGFKVLRFSIGFGKPLLTRVGKDADRTEYCLAAIPLGGYVKLLDEREGDVAPAELHRSFTRRPISHRIAVLLAGPAMNLLFASLLYAVLAMVGTEIVKPVVGQVRLDSPAAVAGLQRGDEIVRVGDTQCRRHRRAADRLASPVFATTA